MRSAPKPIALVAGLVLLAAPALAHHSFAMFDRGHPVTLSGVVKDFQWTNPHVWIDMSVPNASGGADTWGVECTSVVFMTRKGWAKDSIAAGDKIVLTIAPLKDGSKGGSLMNVASVNGKPMALTPEE